jgi:hypothetical protein
LDLKKDENLAYNLVNTNFCYVAYLFDFIIYIFYYDVCLFKSGYYFVSAITILLHLNSKLKGNYLKFVAKQIELVLK